MRPKKHKRPRADLPLAPLQQFRTADFIDAPDRDLAAFMLIAALAFNDIKDLAQSEAPVLAQAPPDPKAQTAESGEYAGRRMYIFRMMAGRLNEVFGLIERHDDLISTPAFQRCVKRLPHFARDAWNALYAAATGEEPSRVATRRTIVAIRNNIAFHYYQPKALYAGLRAFLESENGDTCYVSLGANGEASRFYFADAAAQFGMNRDLDRGGVTLEDLIEYGGHVMDALRWLVAAYLVERKLVV